MNVSQEISEARARATALREAASLQAMTLLAVRSLDRIEQLTGGLIVEMLLIQAQLLLEDAHAAAEFGDPATHGLHRQAREVVGAALDRCFDTEVPRA